MSALAMFLAAVRRHRVPAALAFSAVLGSALAVGVLTPPAYRSQTRLIFQDSAPKLPVVEGFNAETPFTRTSNRLENKMEMVKTFTVLDAAIKKGKLRDPETGEPLEPGQLRNAIAVQNVLGTDMVDLAYTGPDPAATRATVEALTQALIDDAVTSTRLQATALRQFIERKLPEVERRLKASERERENYQKQSGSVELGVEAQSAVQNLAQLEANARQLAANEASLKSRIGQLRAQLGGKNTREAVNAVAVSADPDLQGLRKQLSDLDGEIARQEARMGPRHPYLVMLKDQRKELSDLISKRVRAITGSTSRTGAVDPISQTLTGQLADLEVQLSGTQKELARVRNSVNEYRGQLAALPARQVRLAQLERKVQVETTAFNLLANRLEEARIAEAQTLANIRVVEPASEPTRPVWPNFTILGGGGVLLGAGAALAMVLVGELRRKTLSVPQMQDLLQVPVLASLPEVPAGSTPLLNTWNREAYRMLCMNLQFLARSNSNRTIVVSSAIANEGKSTVASQLARSFARSGRRTLLIDADLVRPSLASMFDVEGPGLGEWLNGSGLPVASYALKTPVENLELLTAGQVYLPDSAGLLSQSAVDRLLDELEDRYEQIVIDTPPLAGYAHGYALGARSLGVLLVLRPGGSDTNQLSRVKQTLDRTGIHLLGTVINGVDATEEMAVSYYQRPKALSPPLLLPE